MNIKKNKDQPNIIFIMTDEQRYDNLGFTNPNVITPNLDKLAEDSVFFDRAYTTNPSCVPARASIFTGKYPHQCQAPTYTTHLPETEKTFMSYLQETGYYTAVTGKQHFGETDIEKGYDYEDIIDLHTPRWWDNSNLENSYYEFLAEEGFENGSELIEPISNTLHNWKVDPKYYVDNFVGTQAVKWLKNEMPEDKPWFKWISFPGPHMPIDCINMPQADLYNLEDIDLPKAKLEDIYDKPPHYLNKHGNMGEVEQDLTDTDLKKARLAYYANMTLIDDNVGEIIDALKEAGEYDNSMIVFFTDHGDFLGDFNRIGKAQFIAEALMHIPFFIKPPVKDFPGKVESSLVSSVDIAATTLSVAGGEIPEDMSSRDLSNYWGSLENLDDRDEVYMEAQNIRGIRTRKYKLAYYQERSYGELYDLENDPAERNNLWDKEEYKEVKQELKDRLLDKLISLPPRSHEHWNTESIGTDKEAPEI